jgi:hypothetical protein
MPKPATRCLNLRPWQSRALQNGATQLWVPMREQPDYDGCEGYMIWRGGKALLRAGYGADYVHSDRSAVERAMMACCPYPPGTVIVGRETLNILDWDEHMGACVQYAASASDEHHGVRGWTHDDEGISLDWGKGKNVIPASQMPAKLSRFRLPVIARRPQKVAEISDADARACGITPGRMNHGSQKYDVRIDGKLYDFYHAAKAFQVAWESMYHPRYPWASAWAWRIEVKR